jgi:hypothetical protein
MGRTSNPGWPEASEVVLNGGERRELPVTDTENVDLIDVMKAFAGGRYPVPLTGVRARAAEVPDYRVVFGEQVHDPHREVRKRALNGLIQR